jgi:hypothetical protein
MLVRQLCEKAPQSAESLGTRIIEYVRRGDHPDDVIEEPAAQSSAPVRSIAQSRKHKAEDSSYRPPKYAKGTDIRSTLETGEKRQSARLGGGKLVKVSNTVDGNAPQDSAKVPCKSTKEGKRDSKVANSATRGDTADDNAPQDSAKVPSTSSKEVECDDSKVNNSTSPSDQVDDSPLDPAKATSSTKEAECDDTKVTRSAIRSVLMRSEGTNTSEGVNQAGLEVDDACMVVYNRALDTIPSTIREESVPPNSRTQGESPKSPKLGELIQSTPAHQTKADPIESPQTEEIYREKIPTSLESIRSSPGLMNAAPENVCAVTDHILEAVRIIHGLSKHQDGLPRPVHVAILQALGDSRQDMLASSDWSSGSMWMDILEAGSVEGQKVTILRMLEYMGAWEWYDSQVRLVQESGTIHTKKNKPVGRKGAATHVLNKIQRSGKYIKSLGKLTLENDGNSQNDGRTGTSSDGQDTITERKRKLQRQRIVTQLSRGQKLSTKLVKELGLGILFSPQIW